MYFIFIPVFLQSSFPSSYGILVHGSLPLSYLHSNNARAWVESQFPKVTQGIPGLNVEGGVWKWCSWSESKISSTVESYQPDYKEEKLALKHMKFSFTWSDSWTTNLSITYTEWQQLWDAIVGTVDLGPSACRGFPLKLGDALTPNLGSLVLHHGNLHQATWCKLHQQ